MNRPGAGFRTVVLTLAAATACTVSPDDERALGAQFAEQIDAQLKLITGTPLAAYVDSLGRSIAAAADSTDRFWRFSVVDDQAVNAFAVPGGYIYINRGIIEKAEDMSELAGVLGHEIGHVLLRHSAEQMEKRGKANVIVTLFCGVTGWCSSEIAQVAINVGGAAVFARHSREDEAQADSVAVTYLYNAGIDPRGVAGMFERLLAERMREPDAISAFFASHPLEEDRVVRTRALVRAWPEETLDRLRADDVKFEMLAPANAQPPAH
ncbi:MAG: M48 family metallopeptidase [Gemmatimonadota bacterium]